MRPNMWPRDIAQEYDRDYGRSSATFFPIPTIERLLLETARPPLVTGELIFDTDSYEPQFQENALGRLNLWFVPLIGGRTSNTVDYIVGADVAVGLGGSASSNSVLSVMERPTGLKVAELASPTIPPEYLADYAVAMCKWFVGPTGEAYLIWEAPGPGRQFGHRIREIGFNNVYFKEVEDISGKKTKKLGFQTQRNSKRELLGWYSHRLVEGTFTNPSKAALTECKDYHYLDGGLVAHIQEASKDDPTGAGVNHGDRVIADALCAWAQREFKGTKKRAANKPRSEIPYGSFLDRRKQWESQQESRKGGDWAAVRPF